MSFDGRMNKLASLYQATVTASAMGGGAREWTLALLLHPCRLDAVSATERAMSGSTGVAVTHRMYCRNPVGVTVSEKDRWQVAGIMYEVVFVNDVQGDHMEIDLLELRRGS